MANRHLTVFALLGSVAFAGVVLEAADTPPSDLKLVNGHWTAWDPPQPPEGAKVHVVVPGDTFWDLAATNLGNPYLWPQLWEKNQYVRDAHWIYPGDPLILDLQVSGATMAGTGAAEETVDEGAGMDASDAGMQDSTGAVTADESATGGTALGSPAWRWPARAAFRSRSAPRTTSTAPASSARRTSISAIR